LDRARYDLGYRATVLNDVAQGPVDDKLVVLSGPRRVGKSVVLLDTAHALCERADVDPRQIIHIPADDFSKQDLHRSFVLGEQATRSLDLNGRIPRVWLLDEVSSITDWTVTLKFLRDQTPVGDDTVVATGSRWVGSDDVSANLLAGRAGRGNHRRLRHLMPMSFRDFIGATRTDLPRIPVAPLWELQSKSVAETLEPLSILVDDYDLAWQSYLQCGGFPRAVYEFHTTGGVSDAYLRDLERWLVADVDAGDAPDSVELLLDALTTRATSPMNVASTARDLGFWSPDQLARRIQRLISTFAAIECPQRTDKGFKVGGRTQAKVYLSDPVLSWLPSRLRSGLPEPSLTTLTEMAMGVTQALAIDEQQENRMLVSDTIGYLRTTSGQEVDLAPVAVPSAAGTFLSTPLESKWVGGGWRAEAKVVTAKFGAGVLATRNILDTSSAVWAIPAPLVAMMLR
jgi:predicted AAA+ superfamily ATPase